MADTSDRVVREVTIVHPEGLHTRPVMSFVDTAQRFDSVVRVNSLNKPNEIVDGKSAMEMMLLEATQGSVLRITAWGQDARETADALAALVEAGFGTDALQQPE